MRYSLTSFKKAINQPRKIAIEVNGYFRNGWNHRTGGCSNPNGLEILEEDWDNLIILDACRYDIFREVADKLPGELEKRESKAGDTNEFLRHTFKNRNLQDTIYITGNPQLYRHREEINVDFFLQEQVWVDNWAENHRTIMPDVMTEQTLTTAESYPHKRIISHYLQPHAPYIGPTGRELPSDYLNFWESYTSGEFNIDLETAKRAYRENVEITIPHIKRLFDNLQGKTIVTADHGELLGEKDRPIPIRRYGHDACTYLSPLVEVPWLVYKNGERKEITSEDNRQKENDEKIAEQTVTNRLKDLGYV
jgi:hypothetical protein